MVKFILAYVNLPNNIEKNYDKEFATMILLMAFVNVEHPDFTSYGITVLK